MEDDEPILLHEPDLMLAILRSARQEPASLDDAMARLLAHVADAHERAPRQQDELRRRLEGLVAPLLSAGAIVPAGDDRFRLTERGTRLLAEHPDGIDASVLCAFPEFRAFMAWLGRERPRDDPHWPASEAGMLAFAEGRPNVDNPHAFDSADHLAWECGWFEASDEARRGRRR
jgi:hypothetical protein